jgi:hypothetical protein
VLTVICFSKDRPMQLEAYLESLCFYSGLPQTNLVVLYRETNDISYDSIQNKFSSVVWKRESNFYVDLYTAVESAEDYIMFGCDDVLFKGNFDVNEILELLETRQSVFGFSLRLGANLNFLPMLRPFKDFLIWDWKSAPAGNWNYPWEVSASVYKKSAVLGILDRFPGISNPNVFESAFAQVVHQEAKNWPPELACFSESKCVTLTINRVQNDFPNEFDSSRNTDQYELFRVYSAGKKLDWSVFYNKVFKDVHINADLFRLVDEVAVPAESNEKYLSTLQKTASHPRFLKTKFFIWWLANFAKESLRPFIPRAGLRAIKRILGR